MFYFDDGEIHIPRWAAPFLWFIVGYAVGLGVM